MIQPADRADFPEVLEVWLSSRGPAEHVKLLSAGFKFLVCQKQALPL